MNTTTRTVSSYFERKTRDSGEAFYSLTDDAPAWLHDAVMEAHDGELPNDWRYDTCHSIVLELDDVDDASEIADGLVDTYTSDLLAWLAGHLERKSYCDEAADDYGRGDDIESEIRLGQNLCIGRMASILLAAIAENADES